MTIDERIDLEKHQLFMYKKQAEHNYISGFNSILQDSIDNEKQLIEWLEELKDLHKWKEQEEKACDKWYNKAIDDFVEYANTMPTVENEDGEIRPMWLEEIAEQLKENKHETHNKHNNNRGLADK